MSRLAIIAGAGRFPFYVAEEAKRQGLSVIALGIQGWADPELARHVEAYEEIHIGKLGQLIQRLKAHGAQQVLMAGKVTKEVLFKNILSFDREMLAIVTRVRDASVNGLLGAVGDRLAREGIQLLDSSTYLKTSLCPADVLTLRRPSSSEQEDIQIGLRAARTLADLDAGQTVVVKERVIVALEALEGTDAAIRRAHALAGDGLVVVKTAAPKQDRRFDLPVIGMTTIETLRDSGVRCMALEAGATLLLDRAAVVAAADAAQICLIGVNLKTQSQV